MERVLEMRKADLCERLGHRDVVARYLWLDVRRKRSSARLGVAKMLVKRQEAFRAGTDDSQIHRVTTGLARIVLGGRDKPAAQAHALSRGVDGQQPQVTSRFAHLDVHATSQTRRVFPQQKRPFIQESANTLRIDAVAVKGNPLDDKSGVDEP